MCKGAVHDFELFKRNQHLIPKESFVLADKGYQGIYAIYERRIGIEHVFGVLKTFRILSERYRNRGKRLGLIFNLIAGIYNLELNEK